MFNKEEKRIRSNKGFTMIELIIVIAIMGILSAALVPSFTEMTRKSRLRADISTIQQVQTQINIYIAEQDGKFPGTELSETGEINPNTIKELVDYGYIKKTDTTGEETSPKIKLQSGIKVHYDTKEEHLVLSIVTNDKLFNTADKLSSSDKEWTTLSSDKE